jgi:hypothetical protein
MLAGRACRGWTGHSTSTAHAQVRTSPLVTIFEASELLERPGPTLDVLKRLGVDDVKVCMPWDSLAPRPLSRTPPRFDASSPAAHAAANWAPYDAIVQAARAREIGLDLALEHPAPLWATGPGVPQHDS